MSHFHRMHLYVEMCTHQGINIMGQLLSPIIILKIQSSFWLSLNAQPPQRAFSVTFWLQLLKTSYKLFNCTVFQDLNLLSFLLKLKSCLFFIGWWGIFYFLKCFSLEFLNLSAEEWCKSTILNWGLWSPEYFVKNLGLQEPWIFCNGYKM